MLWTYNLGITDTAASPLSDPLTFSGTDLIAWLTDLKTTQTSWTFGEVSQDFDGTSGEDLGGISYQGQGVITEIDATPEPATMAALLIFEKVQKSLDNFAQTGPAYYTSWQIPFGELLEFLAGFHRLGGLKWHCCSWSQYFRVGAPRSHAGWEISTPLLAT
ncbi:MAG: hypothetical protein ABSG03_32510 [Bryobacteraceae bacterium]